MTAILAAENKTTIIRQQSITNLGMTPALAFQAALRARHSENADGGKS